MDSIALIGSKSSGSKKMLNLASVKLSSLGLGTVVIGCQKSH